MASTLCSSAPCICESNRDRIIPTSSSEFLASVLLLSQCERIGDPRIDRYTVSFAVSPPHAEGDGLSTYSKQFQMDRMNYSML